MAQGESLSAFLVFDSIAKLKPASSGGLWMVRASPARHLGLGADRAGMDAAAVVQVLQRDMRRDKRAARLLER